MTAALPSLRQLSYLCALEETGSFTAAAERTNVSQSTLSSGLRELERRLGIDLIDRTRRDFALTAAGRETVARAREILVRARDLTEAVRSVGEPLSGPFSLGVIPTIAPFLLPRWAPVLAQSHPRLELKLQEDVSSALVRRLRDGALDAAVLAFPYHAPGLETAMIGFDRFYCLMPANDPLANQASVDEAALSDRTVLLLEDGHCLRDHALDACRSLRSRDPSDFTAKSLHTLAQMVATGAGVTLAPALALEAGLHRDPNLAVRPLEEESVGRHIGLAWRRGAPQERHIPPLLSSLHAALGNVVSSNASKGRSA